MQLRHIKCVLPPTEGLSKVTSITWSDNGRRMAVVTADRIVHLYDENGERRDKFSTKPSDPNGSKNYLVRGMAFSPDSQKLAIGQSDNIVFVYKLGSEWGEKKSICNKFHQSSAITTVCWPHGQPNEVVFGLAEGKVKVGQLKNNKPATLYVHPDHSYVCSLTSSPDGRAILSGHLDGSIYRFLFDDGVMGASNSKLVQHPVVPYGLAWGESVCAAGSDCKVVFYDNHGGQMQLFDYSSDEKVREFTCASFNPSGETVVVGSFNRYYIFSYNITRQQWEEAGVKIIENMYSVTALGWKPDGSRLSVGSLCGGVDVFDACIRRHMYKGKFEFTYVSNSQVIVKRLQAGTRIVLKSHFGYEITKIDIYDDQFLVAHTPETLLMGDLETCKLSEVPWNGSGKEKFFFDNPQVCLIYNAGELSLVEYGHNEVLGTCRTEYMSPYLISIRVSDGRPLDGILPNKKIAYLIDVQTVRILDLLSGITVATINHETRIDWLELNTRGSHLLFRDKKRQLHLYDIAKQERTTMLHYCSYVQWVPHSDVVVAQNRGNLCVWYSIEHAERVTVFPIKGEVEDIERERSTIRGKGRTEVIVDEGINTVSYALDETLIEFGTLLDDKDYELAADMLEPLELTPETEALWQQLSSVALADAKPAIAERCYAALGDVSKARFLHKINKVREAHVKANEGQTDGLDNYLVRAKLEMLNKQYKAAEQILLENGRVDEAISMYKEMQKWDSAVGVAELANHAELENIKRNHYQWLMETGQEEQAGKVKEREGDHMGAISLYLKGGLPGRAAAVVSMVGDGQFDRGILDSIGSALTKVGMYERAGEFFEKLGRFNDARDSYRRGNAYRRAVDLARREFPQEVVRLEEEWGDWLVHQRQLDAAVNHFVEAGQSIKAIEAALECRQWQKAAGIVEALDPNTAAPFYKRIARHYENARSFEDAERYYVRARLPGDAVEMYVRVDKWEMARKVAVSHMSDQEAAVLYTKRARELESQGKYKEAERMYLTVKEHDLAINMYKKSRKYDQMIRLVSTYRKDLLNETHAHLAQQLEADMNFKEAEKHYLEGKDWKAVVQMYRANEMWDDAIRIARMHGGANASKQVAYAWAVSLGGEAGAQLLQKFGLVEQAIDYAMESGAFMHAFELTRASMKQKLPEVHLKYAMYLEDEGRFKEAEEEFIKADKPKEAIDMYIHQQDWSAATRVAEAYDPTAMGDVQMAQARVHIERQDFAGAEAMFIKAKRPELAIKMFKDARKWEDAIRVAEDYVPSKVQEIHLELAASMGGGAGGAGGGGGGGSAESIAHRYKLLERQGQYSAAIDIVLGEMTKEVTADVDMLEKAWEDAVSMAMDHCRSRSSEVVSAVAARLLDVGRTAQAAEMYARIDAFKEAADVYVQAGMWDKARQVGEQHPQLSAYVEAQYTNHLTKTGQAEQLADSGNKQAAIDLYARQGEWDKVHKLAAEQGPDVMGRYAYAHAKQEAQRGAAAGAAAVLAAHGAPAAPQYLELYRHVAVELLSAEKIPHQAEVDLKGMLQRVVTGMNITPDVNATELAEFRRLLEIAHFTTLKTKTKLKGWHEMSAKQATALLRYVGSLPADKAFYEAGIACKEANMMNQAFVFLNRYLDLTEAMEDPDSSNIIENSDFVNTDIPYDFVLPEKSAVPPEKLEEVRDWVLALSMDQQVEQSLSVRTCSGCGADTYAAGLKCHECKALSDMCIITGFPIPAGERAVVKGTDPPMFARKDDYQKFIQEFGYEPWSGSSQGGF